MTLTVSAEVMVVLPWQSCSQRVPMLLQPKLAGCMPPTCLVIPSPEDHNGYLDRNELSRTIQRFFPEFSDGELVDLIKVCYSL